MNGQKSRNHGQKKCRTSFENAITNLHQQSRYITKSKISKKKIKGNKPAQGGTPHKNILLKPNSVTRSTKQHDFI